MNSLLENEFPLNLKFQEIYRHEQYVVYLKRYKSDHNQHYEFAGLVMYCRRQPCYQTYKAQQLKSKRDWLPTDLKLSTIIIQNVDLPIVEKKKEWTWSKNQS